MFSEMKTYKKNTEIASELRLLAEPSTAAFYLFYRNVFEDDLAGVLVASLLLNLLRVDQVVLKQKKL